MSINDFELIDVDALSDSEFLPASNIKQEPRDTSPAAATNDTGSQSHATTFEIIDVDALSDIDFAPASEIKQEPRDAGHAEPPSQLGQSILNSKQITEGDQDEREALLQEQNDIIRELDFTHSDFFKETQPTDGDEQMGDPFAIENEYREAHNEYCVRHANGTLTDRFSVRFLRLESEYDKYLRDLKRPLENSSGDNPKEKNDRPPTKTTKNPRKSQAHVPHQQNFQQSNPIDDARAAEQYDHQPDFSPGKNREIALNQLMGNVPVASQTLAKQDKKRFNEAIKQFTGRQVIKPAKHNTWSLEGLNTTLKPHQVLSASFMRRRENSTLEPRGGILADQMGLGKTVEAIANIVNGRPSMQPGFSREEAESDTKNANREEAPTHPQTTLIVVPVTLLEQWKTELEDHCVWAPKRNGKRWGLGSVKIYREKHAKLTTPADFYEADVVLTSYSDVMRSWPDVQKPEGLNDQALAHFIDMEINPLRGPLHRTHWLRVILDEGHCIRNPETRTAQAAFNLTANHHWVLTGTPLVNGAADLYSLFAFIRHPVIARISFGSFKQEFCDTNDPMSDERLTLDLKQVMSRFSYADKLFAARLVTLPRAFYLNLRLRFSPLEKAIYEIVRVRFQARAKELANQQGMETKVKALHVWTLILRLRQLTAHPLMIQTHICEYLEREDFEKLQRLVDVEEKKPRTEGRHMIMALRHLISQERARKESEGAKKNDDLFVEQDDDSDADEGVADANDVELPTNSKPTAPKVGTGRSHGKKMHFQKYLDSIKRSEYFSGMNDRMRCSECAQPLVRPRLTNCFHVYCKECLVDLMEEAAVEGLPHAVCREPQCGQQITSNEPVPIGKAAEQRTASEEEDNVTADAAKDSWLEMGGQILPSTKTLAIKSQVLDWAAKDPDGKIIIFTQWVPFLQIMSKVCEAEGWGYTTLQGSQSLSRREKNIEGFKTNPETKILISTLKTGGQGLNLTCARFVLHTDPYWNTALEAQAFGRTYRIGQKKETEFLGLTIIGSIDDRLREIKKQKNIEIDKVFKGQRTKDLQMMVDLLGPVEDEEDSS